MERVDSYLTSGRRQSVNSFSNKWNIVLVWPTTSRKKIFGSILGSDKGMATTEIHHNRLTEKTDWAQFLLHLKCWSFVAKPPLSKGCVVQNKLDNKCDCQTCTWAEFSWQDLRWRLPLLTYLTIKYSKWSATSLTIVLTELHSYSLHDWTTY